MYTCLGLLEPLRGPVVDHILELEPGQTHDVVRDPVEEPVQVSEVPGCAGADGVVDGDLRSGDPESKFVPFLE